MWKKSWKIQFHKNIYDIQFIIIEKQIGRFRMIRVDLGWDPCSGRHILLSTSLINTERPNCLTSFCYLLYCTYFG